MKNNTIIINAILEAVKSGAMAPDRAAKAIEELTASAASSIVVNGNNVIIGDNNFQKVGKCRKHRGARKPKQESCKEEKVAKAEAAGAPAADQVRNPWLNKPQYKCDYLLACRSMHVGDRIVSAVAMKDTRTGQVKVNKIILPGVADFVLEPYAHVIRKTQLSNVSICMDVFNMKTQALLQEVYNAAINKGIKVFGVTKSLKEDDSDIVSAMKKELTALSATAKEVLDGEPKAKPEAVESPAHAEAKESVKAPETTIAVVDGLVGIPKQKAHAGARGPKPVEHDVQPVAQDESEAPDEYQCGIPVEDV